MRVRGDAVAALKPKGPREPSFGRLRTSRPRPSMILRTCTTWARIWKGGELGPPPTQSRPCPPRPNTDVAAHGRRHRPRTGILVGAQRQAPGPSGNCRRTGDRAVRFI